MSSVNKNLIFHVESEANNKWCGRWHINIAKGRAYTEEEFGGRDDELLSLANLIFMQIEIKSSGMRRDPDCLESQQTGYTRVAQHRKGGGCIASGCMCLYPMGGRVGFQDYFESFPLLPEEGLRGWVVFCLRMVSSRSIGSFVLIFVFL